MKKSIIILGMLGFSLSYAQQDNNGKVGVNTETPSATLNVKSKTGTTSATKNLELENANGTNLVTVLDNGNIGFGTETPTAKLDLVAFSPSYSENTISFRGFRNNGGGMAIDMYKARGSAKNPEPVRKGDLVGSYNVAAYNGKNYISVAGINTIITGDISDGQVPTSMIFQVRDPKLTSWSAENASQRIPAMTIHHNGNVLFGVDNIATIPIEKLEVNGAVKVGKTTNTCSATNRGTIKYENDNFYGCKSTGWVLLNNN